MVSISRNRISAPRLARPAACTSPDIPLDCAPSASRRLAPRSGRVHIIRPPATRSLPLGKRARNLSKKQRRLVREFGTAEIIHLQGERFEEERALPPIKPLNATQAAYLDALRMCPQVIVL